MSPYRGITTDGLHPGGWADAIREPEPESPAPDLRYGSISVDLEMVFPDWSEERAAAQRAMEKRR